MAQGRGVLTPEVQEVAKNLLGYELTVRELRLMPYLQYTVMNDKRINPNHINPEEREILSKWRDKGWMCGGDGSDVNVTKWFWLAMNEILFVAYVDIL